MYNGDLLKLTKCCVGSQTCRQFVGISNVLFVFQRLLRKLVGTAAERRKKTGCTIGRIYSETPLGSYEDSRRHPSGSCRGMEEKICSKTDQASPTFYWDSLKFGHIRVSIALLYLLQIFIVFNSESLHIAG